MPLGKKFTSATIRCFVMRCFSYCFGCLNASHPLSNSSDIHSSYSTNFEQTFTGRRFDRTEISVILKRTQVLPSVEGKSCE
jgi:hypothetical protein